MVGVLTASTDSGCILGYDLGDKKMKDQRIQILAYEGVFLDPAQVDRLNQNWTNTASKREFKALSRVVANDLSKQFDSQASLSERIVNTTGHVAISLSPADVKKLADEGLRRKLAKEYLEGMGITDTQWVFTWHKGTNSPHGHIAYNRVRFDGSVIDAKNERYRSQRISRSISEKYGLALGGEAPRNEKSLSPKRQTYFRMRALALEALEESYTLDDFKENLRSRGITLSESVHSGKGGGHGLSYSMDGFFAKGSKLDRSALSYQKVMDRLDFNIDKGFDLLEKKFPFRGENHLQYIVSSSTDAEIFRASEHSVETYHEAYEKAREALVSKGYMVSGCEDPEMFYSSLLRMQKYRDYRVGDIYMHADGTISFGQEQVFGDAEKTAPPLKILSESNGVLLVERDEKKAYADLDRNVFSRFYCDLKPFGERFGLAVDENGNKNLITRDGRERFPVWYKEAYGPTEGLLLIKTDQGYNHLDLTTNKFISEIWAPYARPFYEGWAVIVGGKDDGPEAVGKFNFIDHNGELLTAQWFDRVSDFKDGVARFILDGREGVIYKNGYREYIAQEEEQRIGGMRR